MTATMPPTGPAMTAPTPPRADQRRRDPRIESLINKVRARYGAILIQSAEEGRVLDWLATWSRATHTHVSKVMRWSCTEGLVEHKASVQPDPKTTSPLEALKKVIETDAAAGTLFVFRDLHAFLATRDPEVLRRIRDCAHALRGSKNTLILLSPYMEVPRELEKELAVIDFPLPNAAEIGVVIDRNYADFRENPKDFANEFTSELREDIVRACTGLTEAEIEDVFAEAVIASGGVVPAMVDAIDQAKCEIIKKTECLEVIDADEDMATVGGLDRLKAWVEKRSVVRTAEARAFGIRPPKGMLTLGVPGGGKGLAAKAIARRWRLPLLRLDIGAVFAGLVGQSEANLRKALRIIEAIGDCVLWVDEIEKGLAGAGGSGNLDSGVTRRVFGTLLTWLQEKKAPVFVYFTANDIASLPPELLRKGRIDELFFIDLPNDEEREEIIRIHLRKRGRDPKAFDVGMLAGECEGFVGAEIETCIEESLIDAFAEAKGASDVESRHVKASFNRTVPLVRTQREKITRLLQFVEDGRAVRASSGERIDLKRFFEARSVDVDALIAGGQAPGADAAGPDGLAP